MEGLMGRAVFGAGAVAGVLGTCQHFEEAHKDTASAWAATVTAPQGWL